MDQRAAAAGPVVTPPDAPPVRFGRLLARWLVLPLSALPFVAYATLTPEGRLVRDRAVVAVAPPSLPKLSTTDKAVAEAVAPRYEGAVMALAYHGIGSGSDAEGGFVVSPRRFGEHLATLRAGGMNVVTARDIDRSFRGGAALPPNAVMITFDDGRSDAMMFADPLLRQADMSATMFVITDAASRSGVYYAPWKRLRAYARSGRWDIQSHTSGSHHEQRAAGGGQLPALASLGRSESLDEYRERVSADLAEATEVIEENVGQRPVAFAYPFGAYGADRTNDPAIRDILRQEVGRQYSLAFHQDDQEQIPLVTPADDRLSLRRLEVEGWSGTTLLGRIGESARRSGFTSPPPPVDGLDAGDAPAGDPLEQALPAPEPVTRGDATGPVGPPAPAPVLPVPSGGPGASTVPAAPPVPLTPATGPAPTTGVPDATTPTPTPTPPGSTTPTTIRSPVTSPPTTTPPASAPPSCTDRGKPAPGCPPRGDR